jgi:DNA (cytosine-5)-methyltransferase 1
MLNIATVCSGIGAPEKALTNLGIKHQVAYFCEFDKYAVKSYCAIHGEGVDKNLGDLTTADIEKLPHNLDLIVGGTPCQDFSVAGKRAGGNADQKTRSSLMWNFVEIIRETKPRVVIWENVPGCLTQGAMLSNFYKFRRTLADLGYIIQADILNAKNFGVPQNRERVFLIALRRDVKAHNPSHVDTLMKFGMPSGYDCGIRLRDVLETDADEKYYLSETILVGFLRHNKNHKAKGTGFLFAPKDGNCHACTLRANASLSATDNTLIELTQGQAQGNRVYDPDGVSVTLSATGGGMGADWGRKQVFS